MKTPANSRITTYFHLAHLLRISTIVLLSVFSAVTINANAAEKLEQFGTFAASQTVSPDHGAWDKFLKTYVEDAGDERTIIKYGNVTDADKIALTSYIDRLQSIDPTTLTREQAYAYWVNLYNGVTVKLILDNYPLKSIRSLGFTGPWGRKVIKIGGMKLSLNNVEHDILRVQWSDPRTHYAVNCASFGCPNLQPVAFTAENTDELLERGAREYVNHPRGIDIDDTGKVTASSIYNWYQVDFGTNDAAVLDHIRKYASDSLLARLAGKTKIDGYGYDWALNEK